MGFFPQPVRSVNGTEPDATGNVATSGSTYFDHGAAVGATETVDLADGNVHDLTLDQPCTLTLTGATNDQADELTIILRGTHAITWPGSVQWPGGSAPVVDTITVVSLLTVDGGTTWYGFGGEAPAAMVGAAVTHSVGQNLTNGAYVWLAFDTEKYDTDGMHFTSAANLTGTVAKTAASATLTGTGTAFTTELSVGQMISVPGTAAEVAVVTAIASDTSLTVADAFANSASGQTATRVNRGLVARQAGYYDISASLEIDANALSSWCAFRKNGSVLLAATQLVDDAVVSLATPVALGVWLDEWDYVEVGIRAGAVSKTVHVAAEYTPLFAMSLRAS